MFVPDYCLYDHPNLDEESLVVGSLLARILYHLDTSAAFLEYVNKSKWLAEPRSTTFPIF